jgi:hypothetical protein
MGVKSTLREQILGTSSTETPLSSVISHRARVLGIRRAAR